MSILLTGASGFIGRNLISLKNEKFRCVSRIGNFKEFDDNFIVSKIDGYTVWDGAFDDCDSVIHLAGLAHSSSFTESDLRRINVDGTIHLANEAVKAGVKRFIYISSIGVNGSFTLEQPFSLVSDPFPHNFYTQSKLDTELALKKLSDETGLEIVIIRPTLVYGANAPGNFGLLTNLINKFHCLPFGLINNRRDFISVHNLADLLITCVKHPNAGGHTFLAAENESVSTKQFTNAIARGLGVRLFQLPIPASLMRLVGKLIGKSSMIEQLVGNLQVDSSCLIEILDWTPPYTMKESMTFLKQEK
ncbi:NAD-dependent epimerase/dehydratase family protein [Shewanella sp. SG44-2]|uniref:NAD-dependent epimerase/dehydratase family protein n=1 Tax=Shewanella sp. SG44-2 TaxID=2760962 RepID=UPI001603C12A|nr:NAD-dependent epimerase/dehydratase family protein [Shewanella sp. SG44-2]MBB1428482.1 NAD-dependent epimerase/dehydratase family protein [Shewanella sp. SG44-2]